MESSLKRTDLTSYLKNQINYHLPDGNIASTEKIGQFVDLSLDRLETCLSATVLNRFKKNGAAFFNHLFADGYTLFLCYLANTVWNETEDADLASKVYYLNKMIHSFDCMYDTKIPDIFLIVHGFGTMMGKAEYGDYLIIYQGCTIGASRGYYPVLGRGVSVTANSSIIGKCTVGDRATIGTRATIFHKDVPADHTAFIDFEEGKLKFKPSEKCYAQHAFNVSL